ncbi:MBG domain-containing protein [Collinsella ihumii]|uniref:MBG domain-containing protein n=1 Tax=Collinsella ihumii TaxID=1720204 RepID=A0AAW7K0R2_9ACTN|nr:MBG domain-containing protein [Collinsella ihumii]MDN0070295.1 MBG domain-containing protein [Collinsella ihumii]
MALMASLALVLALSPHAAFADGCNVISVSQEDILDYAEQHDIDLDVLTRKSVSYSAQPDIDTPPYAAGSLSNETLNDALKVLNFVRYIAGVPSNVTLNSDYNEWAQAASLVSRLNNKLSHDPSQPAGLPNDLYDLGHKGASSSNLGSGYANPASSIVNGYLRDEDASNIDRVGHRRWVLNPPMGQVGFGYVGSYTAMYAFDRTGSSSCTNVAWPAQNMPVELFQSDDPWSLNVGSEVSESSTTVTLTRERDGKMWNFSSRSSDGYFNVDNGGYGMRGAIIFRPNGFSCYPGDSFTVLITGATSSPIEYQVNFFSLEGGGSATPATIKGPDSFTRTFGDADFSLNQSISSGQTLSYSTSNASVIGLYGDEASVRGAGTATITVTARANDRYPEATKTITVTVNKAKATVRANDLTMRSGTKRPTLTANVTGEVSSDRINYSLSCEPSSKVGTYPIVVTLGSNPNYDVTAIDGTLTVTAGDGPTINGSSTYTRTFGDGDFKLDAMASNDSPLTYTSSNPSVVTVSSMGYVTVHGAGTATITVKTQATDSVASSSKTISITINKAKATVTAQDKTMGVGGKMPELTATVAGQLSSYPVKYTLSCDANTAATGTYTIKVNLGSNPNYDVTAVNGTLTVTAKKTASIAGSNSFTKTFGNADFSLGASISSGQKLTYSSSNTDVVTVSSNGTVSIKGAGNATITITAQESDTHAKATKQVAVTVAKAKATITVDNKTMKPGDQRPPLTAKVTGEVAGKKIDYSLSCVWSGTEGTYPIEVKLGVNPDYDVTVVNGTLTVSKNGADEPEQPEDPDTPSTPVTGGFPDVDPTDWYATEEVLGYVLEHGLMHGYDDGTFGPYVSITRGQVACVLWNMAGSPNANSESFSDVDYSQYYGGAIRWARAHAVINGYGNNTFDPEKPVTREELCAMLANYAKEIGGVTVASSGQALDAINGASEVANWARTSVAWAVDQGIISGEVDNGVAYVNPSGDAWRCAAAKMFSVLHRDVLHLG